MSGWVVGCQSGGRLAGRESQKYGLDAAFFASAADRREQGSTNWLIHGGFEHILIGKRGFPSVGATFIYLLNGYASAAGPCIIFWRPGDLETRRLGDLEDLRT